MLHVYMTYLYKKQKRLAPAKTARCNWLCPPNQGFHCVIWLALPCDAHHANPQIGVSVKLWVFWFVATSTHVCWCTQLPCIAVSASTWRQSHDMSWDGVPGLHEGCMTIPPALNLHRCIQIK